MTIDEGRLLPEVFLHRLQDSKGFYVLLQSFATSCHIASNFPNTTVNQHGKMQTAMGSGGL